MLSRGVNTTYPTDHLVCDTHSCKKKGSEIDDKGERAGVFVHFDLHKVQGSLTRGGERRFWCSGQCGEMRVTTLPKSHHHTRSPSFYCAWVHIVVISDYHLSLFSFFLSLLLLTSFELSSLPSFLSLSPILPLFTTDFIQMAAAIKEKQTLKRKTSLPSF